MIKKIGVTGSGGFIGKFLVKILSDNGFEVVKGNRENAEVNNLELLETFIKNCDAIVHLAVYQNVFDISYDNFEKVNVRGCENVLKLAKKYDKKVILFSSEVVFKKGNDFYSKSKKAQVKLAKKYDNVEIVYPPVVLDLKRKFKWWQLMPGGVMAAIGSGKKKINFIGVKDLGNYVTRLLKSDKEVSLPIKSMSKAQYIKYIHRKTGGLYIPFRVPMWVVKFLSKLFVKTRYIKILELMMESEG